MQVVTTDEAIDLQTNCVCSRCYHPVICTPGVSGLLIAQCSNPNCNGEGFVTRHYAERRKSDSWSELAEARENLKAFIPEPEDNRTCDEILAALGF